MSYCCLVIIKEIFRRWYFIGSCLQLKFPNHQSLLHFLTSFGDICKSSKMLSLGYYDVIWNKSLLIFFPKISWVFAERTDIGRSEYYLALDCLGFNTILSLSFLPLHWVERKLRTKPKSHWGQLKWMYYGGCLWVLHFLVSPLS